MSTALLNTEGILNRCRPTFAEEGLLQPYPMAEGGVVSRECLECMIGEEEEGIGNRNRLLFLRHQMPGFHECHTTDRQKDGDHNTKCIRTVGFHPVKRLSIY